MVMKGIEILGTGRADIPRVVTNDELSTFVDTNDEWISTRTGIRQRHFVADDVKNLDIAIEAAQKALKNSSISPEAVCCVLVATFTPDDFAPSMAAGVHHALGLPAECVAYDISAGCAGFVYAMDTARGILMTRPDKYAIVIGSEVISRVLDFADRNTCVLFGDGAGAVVMGLADKKYIFRGGVDYQHDKLYVSRQRENGDTLPTIFMDGQEVFKFAVAELENGINRLLDDAGLNISEIDQIICHQANERIISRVQKRLEIPEEKMYMNLQNYGNTSAASVPLVISEMFDKGLLRKGMRVIIIGFGAGLMWGGMYIEL